MRRPKQLLCTAVPMRGLRSEVHAKPRFVPIRGWSTEPHLIIVCDNNSPNRLQEGPIADHARKMRVLLSQHAVLPLEKVFIILGS